MNATLATSVVMLLEGAMAAALLAGYRWIDRLAEREVIPRAGT